MLKRLHLHHLRHAEVLLHLQEVLAIGLFGWMPKKPGILLRRLLYRGIFQHLGQAVGIDRGCEFSGARRIQIGNHTFFGTNVHLAAPRATNQIVLGSGVKLGDNVCLNSDGDCGRITLQDNVTLDRGTDLRSLDYGCIEIGQGTYIGPYVCLAGPGHITIGQDCLIASHIGIYANNHNFNDLTRPIKVQGTTDRGIVIEDDCWLGSGVKVLDGVTIGKGSVIGAGAVVTKDIAPFSVAIGVPAKVIRSRRDVPVLV